MKIDILPIGLYEENVYILHENDHVLIVDPGRNAKEISAHINKNEQVDGIVLTHGHADHTEATDDLVDIYNCPVYIHDGDIQLVSADCKGARRGYESPVYSKIDVLPEGELRIGSFKLKAFNTPGHTTGSCLIQYKNVLFTGDTLFAGSIGRTDLFSGNESEMIRSLEFIMTLSNDLTIYPGHGPSSTIGREKKINPYLVFMNQK